MQIFTCPSCGHDVYFHNLGCDCGLNLAFDPVGQIMVAADRVCANRTDIDCNWVPETDGFCRSCTMTETVPDLRKDANRPLWARTELAKRWALAALARWGWFTPSDLGERPTFRLLSENTATGEASVTMGHENGVITLNVTEAQDTVLAERQEDMGELYRTMLGHIRHEIAHFLFLRLTSGDPTFVSGFRDLFGDERADYGAALQAHYASPRHRGEQYITNYATAHPHEDWAETVAHLMHLTALLDSGVWARLGWRGGPAVPYDAYQDPDTEALIARSVELTLAVNHVNRALDLPDLYPFVLSGPVREKLAFVHQALRIGGPG